MSVISCWEISDGRKLDAKVQKLKSTVTYARTFRVQTNNAHDDQVAVTNAVLLAYGIAAGSVYPNDFSAYCNGVSCTQQKAKTVWVVTATYTTERQYQPNPYDDAAAIEWRSEPYQREYQQDKDGNPILTGAKLPFSPGVQGDDTRMVVTVKKNMPYVPTQILSLRDVVNSDNFLLDNVPIAPRQAKMTVPSVGEWQTRNNHRFRVVTFTIHLNSDTWDKVLLNADVSQIVGGKLVSCRENGQPVRKAVPIYAGGGQIPPANLPADINWITAKIYREIPFGILPLS